MNKIFIAGSTGLVGRRLKAKFKELSIQYQCLDRKECNDYALDLTLPFKKPSFQIDSSSKLIFLSAISSPDKCEDNIFQAILVNALNSIKFIDYFLACGGEVLFASSDVVYGLGGDSAVYNELSDTAPVGIYAITKSLVEREFLSRSNFKVMRLSYVFSEEDKFFKYCLSCFKSGISCEIYHPFTRNMIDINDVIEYCCKFSISTTRIPSIANLSGASNISRLDVVELINRYLPLKYIIAEPPVGFFTKRAQILKTESMHLERVLGRPPVGIFDRIDSLMKGKL